MPKIEYEMDAETPCLGCLTSVSLEEKTCPNCNIEIATRLNTEQLITLFFEQEIIDVRKGGLVLGGHDIIDDIPMIAPVGIGVFQLVGYMQGGEFLINDSAAKKHIQRIEQINAFEEGKYTPLTQIPLTDTSKVYNVNGPDHKKTVFLNMNSFVINRMATQQYYKELENLNNE